MTQMNLRNRNTLRDKESRLMVAGVRVEGGKLEESESRRLGLADGDFHVWNE